MSECDQASTLNSDYLQFLSEFNVDARIWTSDGEVGGSCPLAPTKEISHKHYCGIPLIWNQNFEMENLSNPINNPCQWFSWRFIFIEAHKSLSPRLEVQKISRYGGLCCLCSPVSAHPLGRVRAHASMPWGSNPPAATLFIQKTLFLRNFAAKEGAFSLYNHWYL